MRRALITGISGFTGRYLVQELESTGYEVSGIVLKHEAGAPANWFACDLADADSLRKIVAEVRPHVIVHLAAIAFVAHRNVEEMYRSNIVGTRNLLAAAAEQASTVETVLLASSANVYGNASQGMLDEQTPVQPANDYAVTKLAMELMAKLWINKLPIVFARPFNYTGVGQSSNFLIPKIVNHFRARAATIELGNIDVTRDFGDVRNVAHAYRRLVEVGSKTRFRGEVFNVCSGVGRTLLEIIQMAQQITGHTINIDVNPAFVRLDEVKVLIGSSAMLDNVIGPRAKTPIEETLRWMLDSNS
jgi:GDP-6-deoxy-D-talose 4-dehydrogenase